MEDLRVAMIRLAYEKPALRAPLLALLKEAADFDPKEVGKEKSGPVETKDPDAKGHFTQKEFHELSKMQQTGKLASADSSLRDRTIRLAYAKPELRSYLLPLLK